MEEIKDFLHDRVVYALVGINTFLNWIGIDNIKSFILWGLTIFLLAIKIRISIQNLRARKEKDILDLEILKENLKKSKQNNWSEDQKIFYEKMTIKKNETIRKI